MSKFSTLVALSALFAPAAALQPVLDGSLSLDEEFDAWAKHYGKAYTNAGHRSARKAIYAHARAFVIDHNQVKPFFSSSFFFFFLFFSLSLSFPLLSFWGRWWWLLLLLLSSFLRGCAFSPSSLSFLLLSFWWWLLLTVVVV